MDQERTLDHGRTKAKGLRTKDLLVFGRRSSLPDLGIRVRAKLQLQVPSKVSVFMVDRLRFVAVLAGCSGVVGSVVAVGGQAIDPAAPAMAASRATLKWYCVSCHNSRVKSGGIALDTIDLANVPRDAAAWERVIRKLNTRTMPRSARRVPTRPARGVRSWLEASVDRAAAARRIPAGHCCTA